MASLPVGLRNRAPPVPDISPALRNLQSQYDAAEKRTEMLCRIVVFCGVVGVVLYFLSPQGSPEHAHSTSFDGSNPRPEMYAALQRQLQEEELSGQVRFHPPTGWLPVSPVVLLTCGAALFFAYLMATKADFVPGGNQGVGVGGSIKYDYGSAVGGMAGAHGGPTIGGLPQAQGAYPSGPLVDLRPGETRPNGAWPNTSIVGGGSQFVDAIGAAGSVPETSGGGSTSSSSFVSPPVPSAGSFALSRLQSMVFGERKTEHAKYDDQLVRQEFPAVPWLAQQLEAMVQNSIIPPLLQQLRESDELWTQGLRRVGKTLSFEEPTTRTGDRSNLNIVSVFDRNLPPELSQDATAVREWKRRQEMEVYLCHPSFAGTRNYVFQRLVAFHTHGFKRNYNAEHRDQVTRITDSHILENLMMKTLESNLGHEFAARYTTTSNTGLTGGCAGSAAYPIAGSTPSAGMNSNSSVLLRASRLPQGGVGYDVLVSGSPASSLSAQSSGFRSGAGGVVAGMLNTIMPHSRTVYRMQNLLEAFALFFWLKRGDPDWPHFPAGIVTVVRDAEQMHLRASSKNLYSHENLMNTNSAAAGPGAGAAETGALRQNNRGSSTGNQLHFSSPRNGAKIAGGGINSTNFGADMQRGMINSGSILSGVGNSGFSANNAFATPRFGGSSVDLHNSRLDPLYRGGVSTPGGAATSGLGGYGNLGSTTSFGHSPSFASTFSTAGGGIFR
ncbi:unnamed protein product [Amoebophrya sp. A25]|nr:unnamed protein product [Amoebophrya sp. A25]|eukprot:GSA25T00006004001.1